MDTRRASAPLSFPAPLERPTGGRSGVVDAVKAQFGRLDNHVPTFRHVAARLGMSQRTLRRRLKDAHTSYSHILRVTRLERAAAWLLDPSVTVDCIAERLGYSEVANFRHAFRRWAGCSPQAYRLSRASAVTTNPHACAA